MEHMLAYISTVNVRASKPLAGYYRIKVNEEKFYIGKIKCKSDE